MEPLSLPRTPVRRERVGVRRYGGEKSGVSPSLLVKFGKLRPNLGADSVRSRVDLGEISHFWSISAISPDRYISLVAISAGLPVNFDRALLTYQ